MSQDTCPSSLMSSAASLFLELLDFCSTEKVLIDFLCAQLSIVSCSNLWAGPTVW